MLKFKRIYTNRIFKVLKHQGLIMAMEVYTITMYYLLNITHISSLQHIKQTTQNF